MMIAHPVVFEDSIKIAAPFYPESCRESLSKEFNCSMEKIKKLSEIRGGN